MCQLPQMHSNAYMEFGKHKYLFAGKQKQRRIFFSSWRSWWELWELWGQDCDIKVDREPPGTP